MRGLSRGIFVVALLLGCGQAGEQSAPAATDGTTSGTVVARELPRLLDSFEVGQGVYVRSLAVDPQAGALWVGTSVGVHAIDLASQSVLDTFTRDHGLANEYVFAVGLDRQGDTWFGTNAGGASRYRDGKWTTYFPMHGLADYWVYAFASQADGTFWIGTWAGATSIDPVTGAFTTYVKELVNEWVYGIAIDSQDRVWFGTEGGISRFDGEAWTSWTHEDGLGAPNVAGLPPSRNTGLGTRSRHDLGVMTGGSATYNPSYVFSVHVDSDDVVWAGTWGGGVSRFDGAEFRNYTQAEGLAGNIVYSIVEDSEDVLWFGTDRGVSRFDGETWRSYSRHEGLLGDHVYAVAVAPNGDVWAGLKGSVARLGRE